MKYYVSPASLAYQVHIQWLENGPLDFHLDSSILECGGNVLKTSWCATLDPDPPACSEGNQPFPKILCDIGFPLGYKRAMYSLSCRRTADRQEQTIAALGDMHACRMGDSRTRAQWIDKEAFLDLLNQKIPGQKRSLPVGWVGATIIDHFASLVRVCRLNITCRSHKYLACISHCYGH